MVKESGALLAGNEFFMFQNLTEMPADLVRDSFEGCVLRNDRQPTRVCERPAVSSLSVTGLRSQRFPWSEARIRY